MVFSAHGQCKDCVAVALMTVSFTTNIRLLQGCRYGAAFDMVHANAPVLTLAGLSGTRPESGVISTTASELAVALHSLTPTFDTGTGSFTITPSGGLQSGPHVFTFKVVNQDGGQTTPPSLTWQASYVTNPAVSVSTGSTERLKPMFIIDPAIQSGTRAHQSDDNPCAQNTITVTVTVALQVLLQSRSLQRPSCQPSRVLQSPSL